MSKTSAAQLEIAEVHETFSAIALKQQVAERLAAHRSRRLSSSGEQAEGAATPDAPSTGSSEARSNRIANAVAARYAKSPTYQNFLATEAQNAIRQAEAAAEVAARTARAVTAAQQELLKELDQPWTSDDSSQFAATTPAPSPSVTEAPSRPTVLSSGGGLTVKLYEDVGALPREAATSGATTRVREEFRSDYEESRALDEEIAFRQSPTFELDSPSVSIPGNLLEFPRQLVATRKARPRYAEGPLRETEEDAPSGSQLRIFEVEAAQITSAPAVESAAPEWSSIWLDALARHAPEEAVEENQSPAASRLETASIERRLMAVLVDVAMITAAFVAFATAFAFTQTHLPDLPLAALAAAVTLGSLALLYHALFFTLSRATPGMRYARIGLCTFSGEIPMLASRGRRLGATLLAASPMGIGFLWACIDEDRLGWHDRISRTYQRSY